MSERSGDVRIVARLRALAKGGRGGCFRDRSDKRSDKMENQRLADCCHMGYFLLLFSFFFFISYSSES